MEGSSDHQADQGQGGACAIEDAAALAVVLQQGVTVEDVPERLRLYEKIRIERANRLQHYSRIAGQDLGEERSFNSEFSSRHAMRAINSRHTF